MKTYILIPTWRIEDYSSENPTWKDQQYDIPHYFMKIFHSKKDIEKYLNEYNNYKDLKEAENTIESKLHKIMIDKISDKYKDDFKKYWKHTNLYRDITWWVITCDDDPSKENRIGIMENVYDSEKDCLHWKYCSYFGGKVWKESLLFHKFYF